MFYAQVGINLVPTFQIVNPPANVDLSDGLDAYPPTKKNELIAPTTEETALLCASNPALRTEAIDDIELYYVNFFKPDKYRGEAFPHISVPHSKYEDSVIIAQDRVRWATIAHEIGHILLDDGSHPEGGISSTRLMFAFSDSANDYGITFQKRFTADEETRIYRERKDLLTNP
jgi:hypothetical protein